MTGKRMSGRRAKDTKTKEDRLKAALKANLQRRKAQARARAAEAAAHSTKPKGGT
ncbi:MAG: hypothetical protein AAFN09_05335 [Pseudomonadota bacterium]